MLNPLETTRRIDNAFLGYLRSSFGPRRPELRDAYHRALIEGGDLSRGPFVQATAPFKPGRSVDELIRAGVLSTGMRDLAESFPLDRPLHGHQEAAILKYLYRAGGRPVGRQILLNEVWGYNSAVTTHTLETHIYRLRQKIEPDPANACLLLTEGGGYRLDPQAGRVAA